MREKLHQTLRDYDPKDIFNCDEMGLFWKMKPSRTISNSPVAGTKQSKDHVTILFTCNSTGTEKLRPYLYILTKIPSQSIIIGIRRIGCRYRSGMFIRFSYESTK